MPCQNRTMSREDEGYETDRPEGISIYFSGMTDTVKIEWAMLYNYDEQYEWPSNKLYKFLMQIFFEIICIILKKQK